MEYTAPLGFRDVIGEEAKEREAVARRVQDLFASYGYEPIETPTLEALAAMEAGSRIPPSPFKFFDGTGSLVAMRPDVTLQIARMCANRIGATDKPIRLRYMQRVFRDTGGRLRADVRERKQIGIESIGASGPKADAEVLGLFVEALECAGVQEFRVSLATVGVLRALIEAAAQDTAWAESVLDAFHRSNFVQLEALCTQAEEASEGIAAQAAGAIALLARIHGGREAIEEARKLTQPLGCTDGLDELLETYDELAGQGRADSVVIDFSIMSSFDYYTGMVFEAFAEGVGSALGSGGRYDSLLGLFGCPRPAAGFAFYLDEAIEASHLQAANQDADRPLRIAVPKGSLNADAISALANAGLDVSGLEDPGRALIVRASGVEYIIVRPSDAPVFVEIGAADCGICGEDSLIESDADVVELADLRFGSCRFIVAQLNGDAERVQEHLDRQGSLRVATKYPRIARSHFQKRGIQAEVVKLAGNIELGPLTGLSECIVDITATGTTLRENDLVITDEVLSSTARFFANTASFRTDPRIRELGRILGAQSADHELKVTAGGA